MKKVNEARVIKLSSKDTVIGHFKGARGAQLVARRKKANQFDIFVYNQHDSTATVVFRSVTGQSVPNAIQADHFQQKVNKAGGLELDGDAISNLVRPTEVTEIGSIGKSDANAFAMDNPNRDKASTAWVKDAFKGKQKKVNVLNKNRDERRDAFNARAAAALAGKDLSVMKEAGFKGAVTRAEKSRQRAIKKAKRWMKTTRKDATAAAREFDISVRDLGEGMGGFGGYGMDVAGSSSKKRGAKPPYEHDYNKDSVDKAIKKDPRIKGREAKSIHALLKGRSPKNEDTPGATDAERNPSMARDARKARVRPQSSAERNAASQKRDAAKGMMMDPDSINDRRKVRDQFGEEGMAEGDPIRKFNLDKVNPVFFDADAKAFARMYALGNKGDHREGGPTPADTRNSDKFWEIFDKESIRSGFAGSGTTRYINRKTGEKFIIDVTPNGKTFHGSDHHVSIEAAEVTEAVEKIACIECDAVSTAAAWKKNNGTCPKCNKSTQGVAEGSTIVKEMKMAQKYGVYSRGGSIGSQSEHLRKPIKTFDTAEEAKEYAKRMRKQLSKGEKKGYGMSYTTKPIKEANLTEGVLDDMDDDGFMAKRQLYDIAKAAVQLHKQIQDTDNLEPWIQAKITKANDYLETIYHYMEYKNVRDAGETADIMGPADMDNMDAVGDAVATIEPQEAVIEDTDGATLDKWDILRMAYARRIIAPEQYEDPDDDLFAYAEEFAERLGVLDEIGSSDISIFMREFVADLRNMGIAVFGEKVGMYESDVRARKIYSKMMKPLRG